MLRRGDPDRHEILTNVDIMDMEALVDIVQDVKLPTEVPVSLQLAVMAHMKHDI